jgi:tyrosyl-tRNA synthetase
MQGYDSVALNCDAELGGTDQTFNLLAGRRLMSAFKMKPQCAVVMKLLLGSDGKPMGKSLQNFIPISSSNTEMYGQIMSVIDDVIFDYFELVTRVPMKDIEEMREKVRAGENPMIFKKILAEEITSFYHGEEKAKEAAESWSSTFQKGEIPEEMTEVKIKGGETLMEALVRVKEVSSKSDFRRLVEEGAITNLDTQEKITDAQFVPEVGARFKVGRKRFVKITN